MENKVSNGGLFSRIAALINPGVSGIAKQYTTAKETRIPFKKQIYNLDWSYYKGDSFVSLLLTIGVEEVADWAMEEVYKIEHEMFYAYLMKQKLIGAGLRVDYEHYLWKYMDPEHLLTCAQINKIVPYYGRKYTLQAEPGGTYNIGTPEDQ